MIYIDEHMPTNCYDCWIRQNMGCRIANDSGWLNDRRNDKCPLKAKEPRVMTLEEVQVSANPVWLEGGMAGGTWAMMPKTLERSIEFVGNGVFTLYPAFAIDEYGKTWRCWTSRPTDEQREVTPWA